MMLKRLHNAAKQCVGVQVLHTGTTPQQNFSMRLIEAGVEEGWAKLDKDKLTLKSEPEALVYALKRTPGYYCVSTGKPIPVSATAWARLLATGTGKLSRAEVLDWLAAQKKEPTDYALCVQYECELGAEQHAKFKKGA
jgi:hypothetical protein